MLHDDKISGSVVSKDLSTWKKENSCYNDAFVSMPDVMHNTRELNGTSEKQPAMSTGGTVGGCACFKI